MHAYSDSFLRDYTRKRPVTYVREVDVTPKTAVLLSTYNPRKDLHARPFSASGLCRTLRTSSILPSSRHLSRREIPTCTREELLDIIREPSGYYALPTDPCNEVYKGIYLSDAWPRMKFENSLQTKYVNWNPDLINPLSMPGRRSKSFRCGLTFPVQRFKQMLTVGNFSNRVSDKSAVCMAAVLEYLTAEMLELSTIAAYDDRGTGRIQPKDISAAIRGDVDFSLLLLGSTVHRAGGHLRKPTAGHNLNLITDRPLSQVIRVDQVLSSPARRKKSAAISAGTVAEVVRAEKKSARSQAASKSKKKRTGKKATAKKSTAKKSAAKRSTQTSSSVRNSKRVKTESRTVKRRSQGF